MKNNAFILLFLLLLTSCDEKENNAVQKIQTYPMTVGSEWVYDRQMIISQYLSEKSDSIIGMDSFKFIDKVWIEKDTIFNNRIKTSVFKFRQSGISGSTTSSMYKYMDYEGLKIYAYSSEGAYNISAKKSGNSMLSRQLIHKRQMNNRLSTKKGLIIENKPVLEFILPLYEKSAWTSTFPSEVSKLQVDKKVTGSENLKLMGQNFACFKVSWYYLNVPALNGIKMTEWISKEGLMKRLTAYGRENQTNERGEPTGWFETTETLTIKELTLK